MCDFLILWGYLLLALEKFGLKQGPWCPIYYKHNYISWDCINLAHHHVVLFLPLEISMSCMMDQEMCMRSKNLFLQSRWKEALVELCSIFRWRPLCRATTAWWPKESNWNEWSPSDAGRSTLPPWRTEGVDCEKYSKRAENWSQVRCRWLVNQSG